MLGSVGRRSASGGQVWWEWPCPPRRAARPTEASSAPPGGSDAAGAGDLPSAPMGEALSHIRICDFSGQLAGAGATKFLAAFGAQVIRIENPANKGRWDILRGAPPFVDSRRGVEFGAGFNNHNVEKLG